MRAIFLAAVIGARTVPAGAGQIESACLLSDRAGGDRALCACIQTVADRMLTPADQRDVARFFGDPDRSHDMKLRDDARAEAFWARFSEFGAAAEADCAPGGG